MHKYDLRKQIFTIKIQDPFLINNHFFQKRFLMDINKEHFRHCILYEFQLGRIFSEAFENLKKVFGETFSEKTCRRWYKNFQSGNYDVCDKPRPGRPSLINDDVLKNIIEEDPFLTTSKIAEKLGSSQQAISTHIKKLGFVYKYSRWVPHELSEKNLFDRVIVCTSLLARNNNQPFLDRLVTGDEKWITYENIVRKRGYSLPGQPIPSTSKPNLNVGKRMLCVWWDVQGIIHYELLKANEKINSEKYCQQMEDLNKAIQQKRPVMFQKKNVILHHDNARPHTALATRRKIAQLGWEILPHPPYSPDLAPSDFHLFLSLQNFLNGKSFKSEAEIHQVVQDFFTSKDKTFFEIGIQKLPSRWEQVIKNDGHYVEK